MKNKEILNDIINTIALNNRQDMIRCIQEHAGDEFETASSVWEVAKETKPMLRQRLKDIYNY
jgi:hypothetical protein